MVCRSRKLKFLIAEKFQGIRPAPGYPMQPDHTEKAVLFDKPGPRDLPSVH